MAITETNKVDFISIRDSDKVILTISDHLDWTDAKYHLETLQAKLNSYVNFIESNEILESYPGARGKGIIIEIVTEYNYPEEGIAFLKKASSLLDSMGVKLKQYSIISR